MSGGKFWLIWVDGGRRPEYRHMTLDVANAEADRLARKEGKTVFVIETLSVTMTAPPDHILAAADAMHGELLSQIDGLMSAKAGTEEAKTLERLSDIVEKYEGKRFPIEVTQ